MDTKITHIKVTKIAHKKLKILAAFRGITLIALIDQLANEAMTDDELKEAQERKPNEL